MNRPLNIVWITVDQMRADIVTSTSRYAGQFPAFDRLDNEGMYCSNAFAQNPACVPSRISMFTGRYPHSDGYRGMFTGCAPGAQWNTLMTLPPERPNIVRWCKEQGYATCWGGVNHVLNQEACQRWVDSSNDFSTSEPVLLEDEPSGALARTHYVGRVAENYDREKHADCCHVRHCQRFMEAHHDEPFFCTVDIREPHPPFMLWPEWDEDLHEELPEVCPIEACSPMIQAIRRRFDVEGLSDEERRLVARAYHSQCRHADALVGDMLETIDQLGLADNTIVIVNGDHGEFMGRHGCYEKWFSCLYDDLLHVPCWLRLPDRIPAQATCSHLIELVDILPTLYDYLNMDAGWFLHGRSLMPLCINPNAEHRQDVYAVGGVETEALERLGSVERYKGAYQLKQQTLIDSPASMRRTVMLRTQQWKYILWLGGEEELYHLENDSGEMNNCINDSACEQVRAEFRLRMACRLLETAPDSPVIERLWA